MSIAETTRNLRVEAIQLSASIDCWQKATSLFVDLAMARANRYQQERAEIENRRVEIMMKTERKR